LNAKTRSKKLSGPWQRERWLPLSLAPPALSAQSRPSPIAQNPCAQNLARVPEIRRTPNASPSRRASSTPSTPVMAGGVPSSTLAATDARTSDGCIFIMFKASPGEARTPPRISSRSAPATTNSFINSAVPFGRRPITIIESSWPPKAEPRPEHCQFAGLGPADVKYVDRLSPPSPSVQF